MKSAAAITSFAPPQLEMRRKDAGFALVVDRRKERENGIIPGSAPPLPLRHPERSLKESMDLSVCAFARPIAVKYPAFFFTSPALLRERTPKSWNTTRQVRVVAPVGLSERRDAGIIRDAEDKDPGFFACAALGSE